MSGHSSEVAVPDSWLNSCGFEYQQEWQENFPLYGQLSELTHCSIPSTPVLPQQHMKDPSHSAKSTDGLIVTAKHMCTLGMWL